MCSECKDMVALIEKTRDIPGSHVAYTMTIPGNSNAKLIGPDGEEIHSSGTHQLPFAEDWDCGSGQCDPNTGCPSCAEPPNGVWTRRS